MSWKAAQEEASRWLDQLQLETGKIRGTVIDLRPYVHLIKAEGLIRVMVFDAAKRALKKRGADCILPEVERKDPWAE